MTHLITHKPSYDQDFIDLPKDLQSQATKAVHEIAKDPATPRGNTIKKLKGYDNVWRYRLGAHRLVYAVAPENPVVQLLAVGPRDAIYERFNYAGWDAEDAAVTFDANLSGQLSPQKTAPPEWMQHPEWFRLQPQEEKRPLPRKLTPGLLKRWLIDPVHHDILMRCLTEEDLIEAAVPPDVLGRVMDGLWPPTVDKLAQQPDQVLFRPEDLEAYAEGTLRGFLLHLDETQRRYTNWALTGPTLVKGGPGSGKSTVALYRVRAVVERALADTGEIPEILFTTYTNPLINFSDSLLRQLLGDLLSLKPGDRLPKSLRVTTVDKMVMWIAKRSGAVFNLAGESEMMTAIGHARAVLKPRELGDVDKMLVTVALQNLRDHYLLDEFDWVIEGQDCRSQADYLAANRAGRAIPFNQSMRQAVWQLYSHYRDYLNGNDYYTWGQLRQLALDELRSGNFNRRWDAVIVDEAQDLTPAALALCVELCRDPSGLFLTADANQSLYNQGFRWQNVHEQLRIVGRTRILRRNYRTTREIAHAAIDLLTEADGADADAWQQEYVHSGAPPVIYAANGTWQQSEWLAQQIVAAAKELRLPINAAAVLLPSNSLAKAFANLLCEQGLPAQYMSSQEVHLEDRAIKVLTLHAAKGLEFPIVAIAHVEADRLPKAIETTDPQEIEEHLNSQRRLFYVGCTRAMRYLFVTYDRSLPSPFLDTLSDEHWLHF